MYFSISQTHSIILPDEDEYILLIRKQKLPRHVTTLSACWPVVIILFNMDANNTMEASATAHGEMFRNSHGRVHNDKT